MGFLLVGLGFMLRNPARRFTLLALGLVRRVGDPVSLWSWHRLCGSGGRRLGSGRSFRSFRFLRLGRFSRSGRGLGLRFRGFLLLFWCAYGF